MRRPAHEPDPETGPPGSASAPGAPPWRAATCTPAGGPAPDVRPEAPRRPPHPDDDLRRRSAATVRAMVEVLAGRRAPAHLAGVARPEVVRYLTASRATGTAAPAAPTRVHVSRPSRDAAEIVAVCRFGTRSRALAVRLDREPPDHAWRATAVRLL